MTTFTRRELVEMFAALSMTGAAAAGSRAQAPERIGAAGRRALAIPDRAAADDLIEVIQPALQRQLDQLKAFRVLDVPDDVPPAVTFRSHRAKFHRL